MNQNSKMNNQKNTISSKEAYEIACTYINEYSLPITINPDNYTLLETLEELISSYYSFPLNDQNQYDLLVSIARQEVEGIRSASQWYYPHSIANLLTNAQSIEIVKKHLVNNLENIEVGTANFYFPGIYEYAKPCWIVQTKNIKARMEGTHHTDYVIDAVTKEIVTYITS